MIRALIVDDEGLARERLRRLLEEAGDVEIVGEAGDGVEAMAKIAELAPAAVFLDIQMPGATGLDVAASLPEPRPHIIFCTRIDASRFFRISRAAIVNLDAVREVVPTAGGYGEVVLRDGTRLDVSRRRFRELAERLGGTSG